MHLFKAIAILLILLGSAIWVRAQLVPDSFGKRGYFRDDNIAEQMAKPVRHGGDDSCKACHKSQYEQKIENGHKHVSCESCHAPIITHASGVLATDKKIADMPTHANNDLCASCHLKLDARPKKFMQVEFEAHLKEFEFEYTGVIPEKACLSCHKPHNPFPDE